MAELVAKIESTNKITAPIKTKSGRKIFYTVLTMYSLMNMYPIYFSIVSSLKPNGKIFESPFSLPTSLYIDNYISAIKIGNMDRYFFNTVFLTVCTLLLSGVVASMAGYILARYEFKYKKLVFMFFVSGMMIPVQACIIPLAWGFGKLNLFDNYIALILLFTAFNIPMSVFILTGFMESIPKSLEEAAIIDGCKPRQVFWKIIFPLSMPAIGTVSIFNFILVWNNLLFPLVLIRDEKLMTISYGLLSFFAEKTSDYGGVIAGGVIAMLPPMIAYILLQEKVERGMTAGAVKG